MKKYSAIVCAMLFFLSIRSLHCAPMIDMSLDDDTTELTRVLDVDINAVEGRLIKTIETRFCYISFVNIGGVEYIVKQKKEDCLRKIGGVIRDAITAHIAEDFGIAHRVAVIPAGKKFAGKRILEWPATLHSIAPGKMIKAQNSKYNSMNIKQADIGFRRDMLVWMMKHPVLIMVVAMDTFLCNHDRHRGNLFYQQKTDSFCAIDMDSSFKYNLCALACKNFTSMIHNKNLRLSNREIDTLIAYKEYLEFLIDRHHPEEMLRLYDQFAQEAGFVEGSPLYTQKIALELQNNKRVIRESYKDALRLIPILEELIKISKKRLKRLM